MLKPGLDATIFGKISYLGDQYLVTLSPTPAKICKYFSDFFEIVTDLLRHN